MKKKKFNSTPLLNGSFMVPACHGLGQISLGLGMQLAKNWENKLMHEWTEKVTSVQTI